MLPLYALHARLIKPGSHDEISISTGTFDVHKRKHKKNATFVLLMFMLNAHQRFRCLCLFHRVNQAIRRTNVAFFLCLRLCTSKVPVLMLISSCEPGLRVSSFRFAKDNFFETVYKLECRSSTSTHSLHKIFETDALFPDFNAVLCL